MSLYDRLFKPRRYTLPNGAVVEEKRSRAPLVILIVLALGALSVHITGFDFGVLVKKGSKFIRIVFLVVVGALIIKLGTDVWMENFPGCRRC